LLAKRSLILGHKKYMQSYILTARARRVAELQVLDSRRSRAMQVAGIAAGVLCSEFFADRVVLFGSVLGDESDRCFHGGSDIDLAVWGVDGRSFFKAVGMLQGLSEFAIDLVLVDDRLSILPPYILEAIARGVDL
jgi:predicted nucleotidyltransferase